MYGKFNPCSIFVFTKLGRLNSLKSWLFILTCLFCDFPGLELLKNWCVKGYHTGAGMDLAQMVRMAVGKHREWAQTLLVLLPVASVLPVCPLLPSPKAPRSLEKPVLLSLPSTGISVYQICKYFASE